MKEKVGGWQQISRNKVYENNWIEVRHEEVERPNGTSGIYGVVHFKSQAVGVLPLDEHDNTWLVKQSRYTLDQFTWEIPEGGSPLDEDPLTTAKRELEEEVGLKAEHWDLLMTLHTSNSVTDEKGFIFIAREISLGEQALEDSEDIEVKKLPFAEVLAMADNGEITDALSLLAIYKYAVLKATKT